METTLMFIAIASAIACLVLGVEVVKPRSRRLAGMLLVASGTAAVAASLVVCSTLWRWS